jgi:hypothetical protein
MKPWDETDFNLQFLHILKIMLITMYAELTCDYFLKITSRAWSSDVGDLMKSHYRFRAKDPIDVVTFAVQWKLLLENWNRFNLI